MKDGRTHLAYKAEHAVDLDTEAIFAAEVHAADEGDASTGTKTLQAADENAAASESEAPVSELLADKGYHENTLLAVCAGVEIRTCIPERTQKPHRWDDKPAEFEAAFRGNRQRMQGERDRLLRRQRSERCERTFAHVCETGRGRRAWVRGITDVAKLHRMRCAAYNLELLMCKALGMSKPRGAEAVWTAISGVFVVLAAVIAVTSIAGNSRYLAVTILGALLIVVSARPLRNSPGLHGSRMGAL